MRLLQLECPHPTNFDYHLGYQQAQKDAEPYLVYAYCAGLFDGEGCIYKAKQGTKYEGRYWLTMTNKDESVCRLFEQLFGGSIQFDETCSCFKWMATGKVAMKAGQAMLPYLCIKKLKMEAGIEKNFGCSSNTAW
jgi:hypothetical protein